VPGVQFYAGVTGGGATGRSQVKQPGETTAETSTTTPGDPTSNVFGLSGGLAGGLFGVETLSGPWRLGIESDIAGGEISGKTTAGCGVPCRTSNHWIATVRGRAGFDFGLARPYVTGGLAVGDVNARIGGLPGGSTVAAGWTAGAGVQWPLAALGLALPDTVTGRLEWLHVDLGNPQVCGPKTCGGATNASFSSDIFRLGIAIPLSALLP
jgi:outer membrane immunogenic protein